MEQTKRRRKERVFGKTQKVGGERRVGKTGASGRDVDCSFFFFFTSGRQQLCDDQS